MSNSTLLLSPHIHITCPKCDAEFSLEQGFAKQALEGVESASDAALLVLRERDREAAEKRAQQLLQQQQDAHAKSLLEVRQLAERGLQPQLEALRRQLDDSQARLSVVDKREAAIVARENGLESRVQEVAAIRAAELVAGERTSYEKRLNESQAQLHALRTEQVQLREERQRLKDEKDALALEVHRQVDAKLSARELQVRTQEQERTALDRAEMQKRLDDLTGQLADVQRRAEQGSQQLQGEVLELALEEALGRVFPMDTIEEVKKGVRGGDVIQRAVTRTGQPAGVLLWETKRARDWSPQWIAKLKEDMRGCAADVGILVTMPTAIPKDWAASQVFGLVDEVWVTVWSVALQLAEPLRSALLDVHKQRLVSAGKGEKMEAVYDYVTSPQFAQKLRAVYDVFRKMREELEAEKSQATQRWARREKQLQAGVASLLGIGGEIQGLAQQELPALEMEPAPPQD